MELSHLILLLTTVHTVCTVRVYTGTTHEKDITTSENRRSDRGIDKSEWTPVNVKLNAKGTEAPTRKTWRRSDDVSIENSSENKMQSPLLYKIKLTQQGYIQFLRYIVDLPALQDFTFCLWITSSNLTYQHPIMSYSKNEKERYIRSWIDPRSQTLTLHMREQQVFQVPFHMKENRWYHICESFSGYSGNWLVFIDGKLKGNGVMKSMKGTFVPAGGDVVVGQEYTDANKGLDDGIEGEIFGFNLVDEAVTLEDDHGLGYTHYQPEASSFSQQRSIPPFKKIPASKKTIQDIHSYLHHLPQSNENYVGLGSVGLEPSTTESLLIKEAMSHRYKHAHKRPKRPPMRKVVVYEEPTLMDMLFSKRLGEPADNATDISSRKNEVDSEKPYELHGYKIPSNNLKTSYKIYEQSDEKLQAKVYEVPSEEPKDKRSNKNRKARYDNNVGQFSLNLTREANKKYPLSQKHNTKNRPKYHFETLMRVEHRTPIQTNRVKNKRIDHTRKPVQFRADPIVQETIQRRNFEIKPTPNVQKLRMSIPVHELIEDDLPRFRRVKRQTPQQIEKEMLGSFKKLPQIPDGFFEVMENKNETSLEDFFPANNETETIVQPTISPTAADPFRIIDRPTDVPSAQQYQYVSTENVPSAQQYQYVSTENVPSAQQYQYVSTEVDSGTQSAEVRYPFEPIQHAQPLSIQSSRFQFSPEELQAAQSQSQAQIYRPPAQSQPQVEAFRPISEAQSSNEQFQPQKTPLYQVSPSSGERFQKPQDPQVTQSSSEEFSSLRIPQYQTVKSPGTKHQSIPSTQQNRPHYQTAKPVVSTIPSFIPMPVNSVKVREDVHSIEVLDIPKIANVHKEAPEERFDLSNKIMSTGTELVLRSYGQCTLERGSPVSDKKHLLISWSSTPVRIYGGALITNAKNICGYF